MLVFKVELSTSYFFFLKIANIEIVIISFFKRVIIEMSKVS